MTQHLAVADWWANLGSRDRLDAYSLAPSDFIPERFMHQLRSHGVHVDYASAIFNVQGQQQILRLHIQPETVKVFLDAVRLRVEAWGGCDDSDLNSWAPRDSRACGDPD